MAESEPKPKEVASEAEKVEVKPAPDTSAAKEAVKAESAAAEEGDKKKAEAKKKSLFMRFVNDPFVRVADPLVKPVAKPLGTGAATGIAGGIWWMQKMLSFKWFRKLPFIREMFPEKDASKK